MSVLTELTVEQRDIVVHASRLGGWLTASFFDLHGGPHGDVLYALVDRFGLFRLEANQVGGRGIYRLTAAGVAAAAEAVA